jgi:hypothetical protein
MKKTKFDVNLLKEEQNRFKLLLEYDFYQEKKEIPEFKNLILGDTMDEAEEEPTDLAPEDEIGAAADNVASDLGVDEPSGDEEITDLPDEEAPAEEQPSDEEAPAEEQPSDEVEVDVTSIVKGSEEAKKSADAATKNTEMLLQKLADLESRVANMTDITNKIEGLEQEIIKRNPTPVEKLEMRSLHSYPFNQKLSDYWADKEGMYDVMGTSNKPKEYVLTKGDVDSTYSDASVKKSFSIPENPYTEDDLPDYEEEEI